MLIKEILNIYDLLDRPGKPGKKIVDLFKKNNHKLIYLKEVEGNNGTTEFLKIIIPGKNGKLSGKSSPSLGIIGRLGGIGARPKVVGFVSDGDGALTALSIALKLCRMSYLGDKLYGDVIIATHVCTNAPTIAHKPVPFMGSPVNLEIMNKNEVDSKMNAILTIDTSRGNKIINHSGFALSPTVKEGYILRISDDLLALMEQTTGSPAVTFPVTTQDITPYGNGLYHFNSIMQPATATNAPVVGIAITSEVPIAGCATGITNLAQIDSVSRFVIEVAQNYGKKICSFYNEKEFKKMVKKYGKLNILQELR